MTLETRELRAPEGYYCLAVREDGPWHLLISTVEDELWLRWAELPSLDHLAEVDFLHHGEELGKLCALLGMELQEMEDQFMRLWTWQKVCLERISGALRASIKRATKEDILEWREQIMGLSTGEALVAGMTGSDPRAVSN